MQAPESLIAFSLDDVLAALEVRLELEEAIDKLPLTKALEQCLLFAQANNLADLAQFVTQELDGYNVSPPSDRIVYLSYFDNGGQPINGLDQYSSYPLVTGIRKLELHLKNGLSLMLPKQIMNFLSQVAGREVDTGHISPSEINKCLESIRTLTIQKLKSKI
ncbi:MAG: hypothetical protein DCF19_01915 [Pseudanabaena frigida]|uniref:AbiTii domain-containing protein n=1 Tax=Pseudanabaena frigida TaxID=945775 RepID=A0A2W4WMW8_9CYAN|nr:MAG: hypothetical protein DCF19_01915 [Pseudanabaena frigida]